MNKKTIVIKKGESVVAIGVNDGAARFALEQGSRLTYVLFTGGKGEADVIFDLKGRGAEVEFLGFAAGSGGKFQVRSCARHCAPGTKSRMNIFSILSGDSRLDFKGNIAIAREAEGSDAKMTHRTLLMSPAARVDTIPGMEVLARDVKAAHAATVGGVDADALYYLQSRGIGAAAAKDILAWAFFEAPLGRIEDAAVRRDALAKAGRLLVSILKK